MKTFRFHLDILSFLRYLFLLLFFLVFNCIEKTVLPYSTAIFVCAMSQGASVIITPILFILSFLILGKMGLLAQAGITATLFFIIILIYKKVKAKPKLEFTLYTLFALLGFIFLGDTSEQILLEKRILTSLLTLVLTFLSLIAGKAINEKNLKYKLGSDEFACISIVTAIFGLGLSNLISPYLWKGIAILIVLISSYIYRVGISSIIATVLSIGLALFYNNINYVSVFLIYALIIESLMPLSRYASALALIFIDYFIQYIFNVFPVYGLPEFLTVTISALAFCLIPLFMLKNLKEKLYSFREKMLVRQAINRNRVMMSSKLYDLSNVFSEMADSFNLFKKNGVSESTIKESMKKEVTLKVCRDCDNYNKCAKNMDLISDSILKLTDIGFAKGKLNLIDIPLDLASVCVHPNSILFSLNKMLGEYRIKLVENLNLKNGRDLISKEATGVAEILRSLALETGQLLKYQSRLERTLSDNLFKAGFYINELLIYGEDENITVTLITSMKEFSTVTMAKVISKVCGFDMELFEQSFITEDKCYLSFRKIVTFEAVFGISHATKDDSEKSGDTHSVTRLTFDKFLFALSDGMGSGENAENVSSVSLSLIESFYKAGINGQLILNTVNKLLSINTDDVFTALDVGILDLNTATCDFIKYGSPYGFIINENGIKIIEGNSLPLGIIDELKPSVATTTLCDGDMVLLITDGISDSFKSSSAVIDFLRTVPAKNPQSLTDEILSYAIKLNNGHKNDDMTALAMRIYKKSVS